MRIFIIIICYSIFFLENKTLYGYTILKDDDYTINLFADLSFLVSTNKIKKYNDYSYFRFTDPSLAIEISKYLSNNTLLSAVYDVYLNINEKFINRQLYLQFENSILGRIKIGTFYSPFYDNIFSLTNKIIKENFLDAGARIYLDDLNNNLLYFKNAIAYNIALYKSVNWDIAFQRENKEQNIKNIVSTTLKFLFDKNEMVLGYQSYSHLPNKSSPQSNIISLAFNAHYHKLYFSHISNLYVNIKELLYKASFSQSFYLSYDISEQVTPYIGYQYLMIDTNSYIEQAFILLGAIYKVDNNLSFKIEATKDLRTKKSIDNAFFNKSENHSMKISINYIF